MFARKDGAAVVWTIASGETLALKLHDSRIASAGFGSSGTQVITSSSDAKVTIWDVETMKPRAIFDDHRALVDDAKLGLDDRWVVAGSADGLLRISPLLAQRDLVAAAKRAIPRCVSRPQLAEFSLDPVPPLWCVELRKPPYQSDDWQAWLGLIRSKRAAPPPSRPDWE